MFSSSLKFFALAFVVCVSVAHADRAADRKAADAACKADAVKAGCGDKAMGKGLGKCLFKYKQANSSFVIADACKAALQKLRQDRKGGMGPNGPLKTAPPKGQPIPPGGKGK